mmetsp:Transcript_32437/g.97763  ORF Transcript_32437/g.97763 Transcript_32437/m.97763 type:complete len:215 (+) Transcript_32437:1731-2375(+)
MISGASQSAVPTSALIILFSVDGSHGTRKCTTGSAPPLSTKMGRCSRTTQSFSSLSCLKSRAEPKSASLTVQSSDTRRFAAFRSRCIRGGDRECKKSIPRAACNAKRDAWSTSMSCFGSSNMSRRLPRLQNSVTKKGSPSYHVPAPKKKTICKGIKEQEIGDGGFVDVSCDVQSSPQKKRDGKSFAHIRMSQISHQPDFAAKIFGLHRQVPLAI